MDPDAAWATILNPESNHHERAAAALGLLAWLASEGFLPHTDVGRAGVVEVCKVAVEIALDLPSRNKEQPMTGIKYVRLMDLADRDIYLIECDAASVAVWNGHRFVIAAHNRLTDSITPGDGITKGQAKAVEWIGSLPDRIELRLANNKPLFNYLTSLEREHGAQSRRMDLHPR